MENPNNQADRTKKEVFLERMSAKYPDTDFADEAILYGKIGEDYDSYDSELGEYKKHEDELANMFSADPRSAHFLSNWRRGEDPAIQLVRMFGTEIKDAIDDPERLEAIAEANKEYVERVAESKKLDEEYQANLANSLSRLDDIQSRNGLSDDDIDKAMEYLVKIVSDGLMGIFTEESIKLALNALNYDTDVAEAERVGEVRGRNTKIEEKLRSRTKGDGMANLGGKNGVAPEQRNRAKSVFDWANEA